MPDMAPRLPPADTETQRADIRRHEEACVAAVLNEYRGREGTRIARRIEDVRLEGEFPYTRLVVVVNFNEKTEWELWDDELGPLHDDPEAVAMFITMWIDESW